MQTQANAGDLKTTVFEGVTYQTPAADFEKLYAFLKSKYKGSRFDGMNASWKGQDYAALLTHGRFQDLQKDGYFGISRHENACGESEYFNADLQRLANEELSKIWGCAVRA